MGYEKDFVDDKTVEIDVDGRKFMYKPVTGGDENDWLKDVMFVKDKVTSIDWGAYNRKKLANLTAVPYTKENIEKIIGVPKPWINLTTDERYKFIGKLKPGIFDKLINAMKKVDEPDIKTVKNSQG